MMSLSIMREWLLEGNCGVHFTPVGLLQNFFGFLCRDERDHVLSLLGIFEMYLGCTSLYPGAHFRSISYGNSLPEVYTAFAKYQLEFKACWEKRDDSRVCRFSDIVLLLAGATQPKKGRSESSPERTPSWVPDWRNAMQYEVMSSSTLNIYDYGSKEALCLDIFDIICLSLLAIKLPCSLGHTARHYY
jgi:hypothetical protein